MQPFFYTSTVSTSGRPAQHTCFSLPCSVRCSELCCICPEAEQQGLVACPTIYSLLLFVPKQILCFASGGRGHSRQRTWDLPSFLQPSSAVVPSAGRRSCLLLSCTIWLLSKSILKCKVQYINVACCVCVGIPFLSQKHGTCFLCLLSCRTDLGILAPALEVRHISLPIESLSVWKVWQQQK